MLKMGIIPDFFIGGGGGIGRKGLCCRHSRHKTSFEYKLQKFSPIN
jgi:hypothetical protein